MKKITRFLLIVICIFCLSGCFDYKEINEYAIVSGISIDKCEKENCKYTIGVQIMNAKKDEESDNSLIAFYKADSNTIYEALEKIMLDSPKELYLGHNEVTVISDKLLKEKDPLNYFDYFMRDMEMEKNSLVIASKNDKAYNVLKIITPLETIPSKNLRSTLTIADKFSGTLTVITADEFASKLLNTGKEPVLPSIKIIGSPKKGKKMDNIGQSNPDAKLKFSSLGFFEKNRLKGYLTDKEAVGYNILAGTQKNTYIQVKCDSDNYAIVRINSAKKDEKLYFKDNKPKIDFNTNVNADLIEYNCKADFIKNEKKIKELEIKVNKEIEKIMKKTINRLYNENKSDTLEYGSKFNRRYNRKMKKLGYNPNNIINNISFKLKANTKINSTNLSIKSVKEGSKYE